MSHPKVCFDRILPADLIVDLPDDDARLGPAGARILKSKKWPNGSTLSVKFFEGTTKQKADVKRYAVEWSKYANLTFDFNDSDEAEIRITFNPNLGAWSCCGTDSKSVSFHNPTMNLGWVEKGVVLHEFGHAIGLIHEHQNRAGGGIKWNKAAVIRDLSGPPNNWDRETIEHNMFKKYSRNITKGTKMDPKSIMMYTFSNDWTKGDFETTENKVLSKMDKEFIGGKNGYPKT